MGGGDPDNDYQYFRSGTGLNFSRYTSPVIDAAMDAGRATGDAEERKKQYAIVQEELAKAMPYGWLGTNKLGIVARADLLGISDFTLPDGTPGQPMTSGHFFLKDAWLNV
jgi:peptide/nickel transport system substrate-binding protein